MTIAGLQGPIDPELDAFSPCGADGIDLHITYRYGYYSI